MQSCDRHQLRLAAPAIKATQGPVEVVSSRDKVLQTSAELDLHRFLPLQQVGHGLRFIQQKKPYKFTVENMGASFKNSRTSGGFVEKLKGFIIIRVRFFASEWRLEKERGDLDGEGRKVRGRRITCMDLVLTGGTTVADM